MLGGLGAWLSFGYIGARHKRLSWVAAAVAYVALELAALMLMTIGPDSGPLSASAVIGFSLFAALWPVSVAHALWVNFRIRLPLIAAE